MTIPTAELGRLLSSMEPALRDGVFVHRVLPLDADLHAVGFTAAFSAALGDAGISCNVFAGAYHDHVFVPFDQGERAVAVLRELQHDARHQAGASAPGGSRSI